MNWVLLIGASAILHAMWMLLLKRDMKHHARTQIIAINAMVSAVIAALFFDVDFGIIITSAAWLLIMLSFVVSLAVYCGTMALKRMPISIYAPMVNLSPIFLLVMGYFLLGETISPLKIVGLFITLGGAMLLDLGPDHKVHLSEFFKKRAVIVMLLAGLVVSFSPIFIRLLLRHTDAFTIMFWFSLFVSIIYWVIHWVKHRKLVPADISIKEWPWLLVTGMVIFASDATYLSTIAIPGTVLVVIVGVRRLSTLFATLFGGRLLHEDHLLYKSAMCALMIVGTLLLVL